MKKLFFIAGCVFITACFFTSCKKGDVGPAGAQGQAGPAGPAGPTGPTGPTGPQGNANVKTDTFRLVSSQWAWNSNYSLSTSTNSTLSYFTRYHDRNFAAITQDVLDKGFVLFYIVTNVSTLPLINQWTSMPYHLASFGADFTYNIVAEAMPGKFRLHFFFSQIDPAATIPTLQTYGIASYKFKAIAVTGSLAGRGQQYSEAELRAMPYKEVCAALGIEE